MRRLLRTAIAASLGIFTAPAAVVAADPAGIEPFGAFIGAVRAAGPEQYASLAGSRVASASAFAEMKAHVLRQYEAVDPERVRHGFADDNGSIFDCVPVEQQPALRGAPRTLPSAPDLPRPARTAAAESPQRLVSPLSPTRKDAHGNVMFCDPGTIPLQRITLEQLARFDSLRGFFQKSPGEGRGLLRHGGRSRTEAPGDHLYAHAFQFVSNLGGHSVLSLWNPPVRQGEVFSLSQQWYAGGSGTGLQTAEVGWQVYPQLYGRASPVFFIYWTADGYNSTGCYNLSCSAFVQTNGSWAIGGAFGSWSVIGGAQRFVEFAFYLYRGNWWLYANGTTAAHAIGYYPGALYRGGVLAARADRIDYGGETVGNTSWPPMGSGRFAQDGYLYAAYQRTIYYYPTTGGAVFARLTKSETTPSWYTANVIDYAAPWNQTIFFGGPGGAP
jgi:hypothetical protein